MSDALRLLYVPCKSEDEAQMLGHALLDARLIACANLIPGMRSLYVWEGKKEESRETILLLKTHPAKLEAAKKEILRLHSYSCPCVLEIEVASVNPAYAEWVRASVHD